MIDKEDDRIYDATSFDSSLDIKNASILQNLRNTNMIRST